jgi:hypothetical protein
MITDAMKIGSQVRAEDRSSPVRPPSCVRMMVPSLTATNSVLLGSAASRHKERCRAGLRGPRR